MDPSKVVYYPVICRNFTEYSKVMAQIRSQIPTPSTTTTTSTTTSPLPHLPDRFPQRADLQSDRFCHICQKTFSRKGNLVRHLRLHEGVRPFVCGECGKRCASKCNLQSHLKVHQKPKINLCEFCGKTFKRGAFLKRHEEKHIANKEKKVEKYIEKARDIQATFWRKQVLKIKQAADVTKLTNLSCKKRNKNDQRIPRTTQTMHPNFTNTMRDSDGDLAMMNKFQPQTSLTDSELFAAWNNTTFANQPISMEGPEPGELIEHNRHDLLSDGISHMDLINTHGFPSGHPRGAGAYGELIGNKHFEPLAVPSPSSIAPPSLLRYPPMTPDFRLSNNSDGYLPNYMLPAGF